jgi:hypothetical protein
MIKYASMITLMAMLAVQALMAPAPKFSAADEMNAEFRRLNLDYFKTHLSQCLQTQIRCLWFLNNEISVGKVMTIDLRKRTVYTVRDVYSHAARHRGPRSLILIKPTRQKHCCLICLRVHRM